MPHQKTAVCWVPARNREETVSGLASCQEDQGPRSTGPIDLPAPELQI